MSIQVLKFCSSYLTGGSNAPSYSMNSKSYHFNQVAALIECIDCFGTQHELLEFVKTVPHIKLLLSNIDEVVKSTLKGNLDIVTRFVKLHDSFGLSEKFDEIKQVIEGEKNDVAKLPDKQNNAALLQTTKKKRVTCSSKSKSKKKKQRSSSKQKHPFAYAKDDKAFASIANLKSVDEWNDEEFQTKVKFLYDLMDSNMDNSKKGHNTAKKHFLAYVCLRLHSGEGRNYDPDGREMEPFKINSKSIEDQHKMFDWVSKHIGISRQEFMKMSTGCSYYWKRCSNAKDTNNMNAAYCAISQQLGVAWHTEVEDDDW